MSQFFQFEADFVASLRCIPMQVRFKLDTCGIKLKLAEWHQFTQAERQILVTLPCDTPAAIEAYRTQLNHLVLHHTSQAATALAIDPNPAWLETSKIPESVQSKLEAVGVNMTVTQWTNLTALQRFVLIKLSRPSHENSNFLPALQEFGVSETAEFG